MSQEPPEPGADRHDASASRRPARHARNPRLERLVASGPRATTRSWIQLVLFVLLLVGLFLSRDEFGRRAAGCYGQVSGDGTGAAPASPSAPAAEEPSSAPGTYAPVVDIRRAPASE